MLAETGEVVGDTKRGLGDYGKLDGGKLGYKIPFPLAMDEVTERIEPVNEKSILDFIRMQVPDFDAHTIENKTQMMQRAKEYLESKKYSAHTFENYNLRGTPSVILVDRRGILRDVTFGQVGHLESAVKAILSE